MLNIFKLPFAAAMILLLLFIYGSGVETVIFPLAIMGLTAFPDKMLIIPRTEKIWGHYFANESQICDI
jgi:hypothetical protein